MFAGLTQKDFDAYAQNKWRSNAFNRERLEVKEKLIELGRALAGALTGADGAPLVCEASVEHPALWNQKQVEAQHLFFARNEAARRELDRIIDRSRTMAARIEDPSPQRTHVLLAVTVGFERVDVALRLHPDAAVDRHNLEAKLAEPWQRSGFLDLLHGLPAGFEVGVGSARPAGSIDDAALAGLLAELARPAAPLAPARPLVIGRRTERAAALAAGPSLGDTIRADLVALVPLYRFAAWSRDNDQVSMKAQLKEESQAKKKRGIAKHDKVRIVAGAFAGRLGVVQEIDAKGALKVLVGKVPIKVKADEVEKAS